MTLPTIHLNGSGRDRLLDQVCEAKDALRVALELMAQASPNARDYYPQGESAWRDAVAEHDSRMTRVRDVQKELEEFAIGICEAGR